MAKNVEQLIPILDWRLDHKIVGLNARLEELTRLEAETQEALAAASVEVDKLSTDLDEARVSEMTGGGSQGAVDKLSVALRNARLTRDAAHESHASLAHDMSIVERALGPLEAQAQAAAKTALLAAHRDAVQQALKAGEALAELLASVESLEDLHADAYGQRIEPSAIFARSEKLSALVAVWIDEASGELSRRWESILKRAG